jgi:hypothetical protein
MAIIDERQVTFDCVAMKQIVNFSPDTALSIGFPNNQPANIVLNPSAYSATFEFVGTAVTLKREKLAALLVSYCIRSGIKIPRNGQRSVRIEPKTVTLVFRQEMLRAPVPLSLMAERRLRARRDEDRAMAAATER